MKQNLTRIICGVVAAILCIGMVFGMIAYALADDGSPAVTASERY